MFLTKFYKKINDYFNLREKRYGSWQIQKVIENNKLYHNPIKTAKITKKRLKAQKKKRITELKLSKLSFYKKTTICLDIIVIHWNKYKRYIFTAIDKYGKIAYARMYKNKSSKSGEDFLYRLHFLLDGDIPRVGHDNGTKFEQYFKQACEKLNIEQYYSRVRTQKDNPNNERFNRTLQEEFIQLGNFTTDVDEFNKNLTEWLIEYNFHRPHQALNYQTPIEASKVLLMYSSCTRG